MLLDWLFKSFFLPSKAAKNMKKQKDGKQKKNFFINDGGVSAIKNEHFFRRQPAYR
jgi:hypothetical protein